jgi:hypothetical protein
MSMPTTVEPARNAVYLASSNEVRMTENFRRGVVVGGTVELNLIRDSDWTWTRDTASCRAGGLALAASRSISANGRSEESDNYDTMALKLLGGQPEKSFIYWQVRGG